jgi:hypothetical protein
MPQSNTLFIFQDNEQATAEEGLPNCLRQAVFMPPHAPVQLLKDEIASAIQRPCHLIMTHPSIACGVASIAPASRSATRKPKSFTHSVLD